MTAASAAYEPKWRNVVERESASLIDLSHRIHAHPEVAWQEERASGWVGERWPTGDLP